LEKITVSRGNAVPNKGKGRKKDFSEFSKVEFLE